MQFTVAPFGIRNSPPELQQMMDTVFGNIEQIQKYINDIVLYTSTSDEIIQLLGTVLNRCQEFGLFLKLSKLELFQPEVTLLGFLVGVNGIRPYPKRIQGIRDDKFPHDRSVLRSFLGSVSFLRKFIPDLSSIMAPLTHLSWKGVPFKINRSHIHAFDYVKSLTYLALCTSRPLCFCSCLWCLWLRSWCCFAPMAEEWSCCSWICIQDYE